MKFGPTKGSFLIIFEHFIRDFGFLLLLLVLVVFKGPEVLLENGGFFLVVFISPFVTISKYLFTKYSIDDDKMIIDSGLFVKKKMEIPLKAITTVDLSQNILFQICKVYKVKADNASQTNDNAKQAEVVMVLKRDEAMQVKVLLESKGNHLITEEEKEKTALVRQKEEQIPPIITCTVSDFILLGILQSKQLYILTTLSSIYGGFYFLYALFFEGTDPTSFLNKNFQFLKSAFGIIVLVLVIYLFGAIASSVVTAVRYYGYTVKDRRDALLVDFGLFTKKHYTLTKEKISGITIKQSVLMRIFGYCTVEVFIIGYGDTDGKEKESSLLHPIAKLSQVNTILEEILPDMSFEREYHKSEKGTLHYYFFTPRVFFVIGAIIATSVILISSGMNIWIPAAIGIFAALIIVTIISVYLEYLNAGIYANEKVVSICNGILAKQMIFVKTGNIESVSEITNHLKKKKGYTSIKLGFLGPVRVAHIKAKNVTYERYNEVAKVLNV